MLATVAFLSLLADATVVATEGEKWVGPIITSSTSLAATFFAFLTARDRLKYDSRIAIMENTSKEQGCEIDELKKEKEICHQDRIRLGKRLGRVLANNQAQMLGKPLPFPNEHGFSTDDDPTPSGP